MEAQGKLSLSEVSQTLFFVVFHVLNYPSYAPGKPGRTAAVWTASIPQRGV